MPFVLTVDQIDSRTSGDLVHDTLARLGDVPTVLPFTRTVGDEFQGLLDTAVSVVDVILMLMRSAQWHIGLGIGSVQRPFTAPDPRAARGDAFLAARTAVERAKVEPSHLVVNAVRSADEATDVETVFRLVGALRSRRTDQGWQVVDLLSAGHTQQQAATQLDITRQAVSQRAHTAAWTLELSTIPTLVRLLDRADEALS